MNYPLSKGLLVSMALRVDHSFAMSENYIFGNFRMGLNNKEKIELLNEMRKLYEDYTNGKSVNNEIYASPIEEIIGKGFYKPAYEKSYALSCPEDFSI